MAKISLIEPECVPTGDVSMQSLELFLRLGFIPSPLTLEAGHYILNDYDGEFLETLDINEGTFTRDLTQFTGHRLEGVESPELSIFESLLLASTEKVKLHGDQFFLMTSGGKDSLSIAWALKELDINTTLIHCTNRGRENELPEVEKIANRFSFDLVVLDDDLIKACSIIDKTSANSTLPIADVAYFAYTLAADYVSRKLGREQDDQRAVIIDGMGNDAYMGHIPAQREKQLLHLPSIELPLENLVSLSYFNDVIHYGAETLLKLPYERHFSGVGFSTNSRSGTSDLVEIFRMNESKPELRRAYIRGAVFDLDCCIRKGVIAARSDKRISMFYPYMSSKLVSFFQRLPDSEKFDYRSSINKKVLRKFLHERGIESGFASHHKGSFRFNLLRMPEVFSPNPVTLQVLQSFGIDKKSVNRLTHRASKNFLCAQKLAILYLLERHLSWTNQEIRLRNDQISLRYPI